MSMNYSGLISPLLVVQEIRQYIMQRFHTAFLRVNAASDELEPDAEYALPLFGYNAYFAVQGEMKRLDGIIPGLTVQSMANHTRSAYHAELRYRGIVATFSSAHREDGMPRPAKFRKELLQARLFDIGEDGSLEIAPPLPGEIYVQIVYGRRGHELDFVKAVCVSSPRQEVLFLYRIGDPDGTFEQVENVEEADWFGPE